MIIVINIKYSTGKSSAWIQSLKEGKKEFKKKKKSTAAGTKEF